GEWEVKKLGDVADIDSDNLRSDTNPNYCFKYISLENVEMGKLSDVSYCVFSSAPSRARRKVQKNDILVATVRPNLKSHLFVKFEVNDLICSTGFSVIRCNLDNFQPEFIYYHFFASIIDQQINTLLVGSNYPAINSSDIKSLKIPIPPLAEQKAIAKILTEMDEEIEALEKKREKYKNIKQGMMQELLTGKTRLKINLEDR
ncbi:MAG: restriction endonuclease subunit S, partial [Sphaerospermopsis kisseleviana]